MPRIALNGLGRIGKLVLRDLIDTGAGGEIVLLNDPVGDAEQHALLMEFDSVHGRWRTPVGHTAEALVLNGQTIRLTHEKTIEAWSRLNLRFHQILYEPCGNPPLLQMIEDLRARIGPVLRLLVTETSGLARPHGEHQEILDACTARDTAKAVGLLRQHIQTTRKETAAKLRRRGVIPADG